MKHMGLIAMFVYWSTVWFILYRWGVDSKLSISDHVARGRQKAVYTPLALLYLVMMCAFLFLWFLPHMQAQAGHYVLLTIAAISLCLTFIIPREGSRQLQHDMYAAVVGVLIFFLMVSFTFSQLRGTIALISASGLFIMSAAGTFLLRHGQRYYIQVEVFYFAMFHALVLLLSYTN